jgi:hypothetical protein
MEQGRITLPRPNRDELIEIRKGKYSLAEIRDLGAQLESDALAAQATSQLPDGVDRDAISRLLADAHLRFDSALQVLILVDVAGALLQPG